MTHRYGIALAIAGFTLTALILPPAALCQSQVGDKSPAGSGLPQGFESKAESYVSQTEQVIRRYDQSISQQMNRLNKAGGQGADQFAVARDAYLAQRDAVLALLREAEQMTPPTMDMKQRIEAAMGQLSQAFEKVRASY